jgi:hypothetical protein
MKLDAFQANGVPCANTSFTLDALSHTFPCLRPPTPVGSLTQIVQSILKMRVPMNSEVVHGMTRAPYTCCLVCATLALIQCLRRKHSIVSWRANLFLQKTESSLLTKSYPAMVQKIIVLPCLAVPWPKKPWMNYS